MLKIVDKTGYRQITIDGSFECSEYINDLVARFEEYDDSDTRKRLIDISSFDNAKLKCINKALKELGINKKKIDKLSIIASKDNLEIASKIFKKIIKSHSNAFDNYEEAKNWLLEDCLI